MVEGGGLENRCRFVAYLGFESLVHRHILKLTRIKRVFLCLSEPKINNLRVFCLFCCPFPTIEACENVSMIVSME